jgi:hypothetical protein
VILLPGYYKTLACQKPGPICTIPVQYEPSYIVCVRKRTSLLSCLCSPKFQLLDLSAFWKEKNSMQQLGNISITLPPSTFEIIPNSATNVFPFEKAR